MSQSSQENSPPDQFPELWERPVDFARKGRLARLLRVRSLVWETQLALLVWILAAWFAYHTLTASAPAELRGQLPASAERVDAAGF